MFGKKTRGLTRWLVVIAVFAMVAAACSSDDGGGSEELTPINLQLQFGQYLRQMH